MAEPGVDQPRKVHDLSEVRVTVEHTVQRDVADGLVFKAENFQGRVSLGLTRGKVGGRRSSERIHFSCLRSAEPGGLGFGVFMALLVFAPDHRNFRSSGAFDQAFWQLGELARPLVPAIAIRR